MTKLESKIKELIATEVKFQSKMKLKKSLMSNLNELSFFEQVKLNVSEFGLSLRSKAVIKEKVFMVVDMKRNVVSEILRFFTYASKLVVSFAVLLLVVSIVFQPFTDIKLAMAFSENRIESFTGEIVVIRDGLEHQVKDKLKLREGDIIQSLSDSSATILFADNSLMRLSEDTEIKLLNLNEGVVNPNVSIFVSKGKVWNNLIGLVAGGTEYKFYTDNLEGVVANAAIFDLELADNFTRVVNFKKQVVLNVLEKEDFQSVALAKGEVLKLDNGEIAIDEGLTELNLGWIQNNLEKDVKYSEELIALLLEERKKKAGTVPGSIFYPVEELTRSAKLAVTLNPEKKNKVKLEIANEKLLEAEVLIAQGDDPQELLNDYKEVVEEVAADVDELREDSLELAEDLNADLKSIIDGHKIVLEGQKESEEVNVLKEVIAEADLVVAEKLQVEDTEEIIEEDKPVVLEVESLEAEVDLDLEEVIEEEELDVELEQDLDVETKEEELEEKLEEFEMLTERETKALVVDLEKEGITLQKFDIETLNEENLDLVLEEKALVEIELNSEEETKLLENIKQAKGFEFHESADENGESLEQLLIEPMVK